jgi:hypothetical protein
MTTEEKKSRFTSSAADVAPTDEERVTEHMRRHHPRVATIVDSAIINASACRSWAKFARKNRRRGYHLQPIKWPIMRALVLHFAAWDAFWILEARASIAGYTVEIISDSPHNNDAMYAAFDKRNDANSFAWDATDALGAAMSRRRPVRLQKSNP